MIIFVTFTLCTCNHNVVLHRDLPTIRMLSELPVFLHSRAFLTVSFRKGPVQQVSVQLIITGLIEMM